DLIDVGDDVALGIFFVPADDVREDIVFLGDFQEAVDPAAVEWADTGAGDGCVGIDAADSVHRAIPHDEIVFFGAFPGSALVWLGPDFPLDALAVAHGAANQIADAAIPFVPVALFAGESAVEFHTVGESGHDGGVHGAGARIDRERAVFGGAVEGGLAEECRAELGEHLLRRL